MKAKPNRHTPARARAVERKYGVQLRKIASHIDTLVKGFDVTDTTVYPSIVTALRKYAESLDIWAHQAAGRVLTDIALRDEKTWMLYAQDMSRGLRDEIRNADTGKAFKELMADQVGLIKSLPLEAARRIHELAIDSVATSGRAAEIAALILESGKVSEARANTIARTEVSRASSVFTQVRAQAIGSEGYIWRKGSADTREDHLLNDGKFFRWDSPPIADRRTGARAHPGCIYNCMCWPEPVIPE